MTAAAATPERTTQVSNAVDAFAAVAADIGALKRELARMLATAGCPGALQLGAMAVLAHLDQRGNSRLSQMAQHLRVDLSVVSRHVKALDDHGFVHRTTDVEDRRAQLLSVTPAGSRAMQSLRDTASTRLSSVLAGWDDDDVATLRHLLVRLHHDLAGARAGR